MDIMTGLAAAGQALDIAKKLREIGKDFDQAEFKMQIAELYTALSDTKIALAQAREELVAKDAEIKRLTDRRGNRMKVVNYMGFNFGIDANGQPIGRPFCPNCEQTKGIQMQITRGTSNTDLCPSCKAPYGRGGYPWRLPEGFDVSGAA